MPLSTSSSSDRLPDGLSIKTWILTVVLATSILASMEFLWRSFGYQPTIRDGWQLWCTQRDAVNDADEKTIVILGHSRIHQAFIPKEFEQVSDYATIQLGIYNSEPIASLIDIAENTNFSGVVVCSVTAYSLLPESWLPNERDPYRSELVEFYHKDWGPADKADRLLANFLQRNLTLLYPDLTPQTIAPDVAKGEWPVQWVWTESDRSQRIEYDKADLERYSQRQLEMLDIIIQKTTSLPSYSSWPRDAAFDRLDEYVRKIQDRGGKVVFLRIVTTNAFDEVLEKHFPRDKFWDVFAKSTSAETIHFRDVPEMLSLQCADGSHLFTEDAGRFTRILARELKKRNIIN